MTYETIRLDIADKIATITLNRPERLNAMPPQMADEICTALDKSMARGWCSSLVKVGRFVQGQTWHLGVLALP